MSPSLAAELAGLAELAAPGLAELDLVALVVRAVSPCRRLTARFQATQPSRQPVVLAAPEQRAAVELVSVASVAQGALEVQL
jgi:hypothetical protein